MKGIVLARKKKGAQVLGKDGYYYFESGHQQTPVGTTIEFQTQALYLLGWARRYGTLVAGFLLVVLVGSLSYINIAVSGYEIMDINPSLEISFNMWGDVVEIEPLNDDGAHLLQGIAGQHGPYTDAIQQLVQSVEEQGYQVRGEPEPFMCK